MSALNKVRVSTPLVTHGGTRAVRISNEDLLRRSVLSCLLWEKEFYEDGQTIADRIREVAAKCSAKFVYELALEARSVHGLRHVPLLLLLDLVARKEPIIVKDASEQLTLRVKHAIAAVIRRPDEITELLAMYWALGNERKKKPNGQGHLANRQLRDGIALAFNKFDEYSLAKYDRPTQVRLRDALFLSHAKPKDEKQAEVFKRLANKELKTPDTWEVNLSAAGNDIDKKRAIWDRMIGNTLDADYTDRDGRLGYLAVLRNIRNMAEAGVDRDRINSVVRLRRDSNLVFPFRYLAAARMNKQFEPAIDDAFQEALRGQNRLKGTTIVLVDVSGSMDWKLSKMSDMTRIDAAAALATIIRTDDTRVFSFSEVVTEVPARRGIAGIDAILSSQQHRGTNLAHAVEQMNKIKHDRLIVITDEQDTSGRRVPLPVCSLPYMINVASNRNGVGYGNWIHLDGFSEGVIRYMQVIEQHLYK